MNKLDQAYKTIGEVVEILDIKSRSGKKTWGRSLNYKKKS